MKIDSERLQIYAETGGAKRKRFLFRGSTVQMFQRKTKAVSVILLHILAEDHTLRIFAFHYEISIKYCIILDKKVRRL